MRFWFILEYKRGMGGFWKRIKNKRQIKSHHGNSLAVWLTDLQYELGLGEDNLHNTSTKNVKLTRLKEQLNEQKINNLSN
jgi:hypothetical protein